MARKFHRITDRAALEKAERDGTKVRVYCGKNVHPKPRLGKHIPTCTACMQYVLAHQNRQPYYTWTVSGGGATSSANGWWPAA